MTKYEKPYMNKMLNPQDWIPVELFTMGQENCKVFEQCLDLTYVHL